MGWARASSLMEKIIREMERLEFSPMQRESLYEILIEAFEEFDADTLDEAKGRDKVYDLVFDRIHPQEGL